MPCIDKDKALNPTDSVLKEWVHSKYKAGYKSHVFNKLVRPRSKVPNFLIAIESLGLNDCLERVLCYGQQTVFLKISLFNLMGALPFMSPKAGVSPFQNMLTKFHPTIV